MLRHPPGLKKNPQMHMLQELLRQQALIHSHVVKYKENLQVK